MPTEQHLRASGKILIVDDEKYVAEALRDGICEEMPDLQVLIASSYAEALRLLSENPEVRFILTDFTLPGPNGRQLIGSLKKDEKWRSVPVAIMSGRTFSSYDEKILQEAKIPLFQKPFKFEALINFLKGILN